MKLPELPPFDHKPKKYDGPSADEVLRLLEQLPENQQEVVRLKFQYGLTYREISKVTKLTVTPRSTSL